MNDKKKKYCKIPPKIIEIYGESFPYEVYIMLKSGKAVRLTNKNDNVLETFEKYKNKGVEYVWMRREDFETFVKTFRQQPPGSKIFDPKTVNADQVDLIAGAHKVVKEAFRNLGASEEAVGLAQQTSDASLKMIEQTPNVFEFFEKFKGNCGEELSVIMMTSYISSMMLQTYDWCSEAVKSKTALGCMLCDVMLDTDQLKELKENEGHPEAMSEEVYYHAESCAQMLEKRGGQISRETVEIVRYHHENPEGTGFPAGVKPKNIPLLTAVYIVANSFTRLMFENKFDYRKKDMILGILDKIYNTANFRNAYFALRKMLGETTT